MSDTWSTFRIWTEGEAGARVEWATNDDNDDGYPDAEVTMATYRFPTVERAREFTGITRRGFYGQPVRVYLDGEPV